MIRLIVDQLFVDRKDELRFLEEKYDEAGSQLIIIYGRRRIGKTELILRFAFGKPYIYMLCEKTTVEANLRKRALQMASFLGRESFGRIRFTDWEDIFREFFSWKTDEKKVVIILDEFPYLIEVDRGAPSVFQKVWDEIMAMRNDVMLILCGSSVGMMETYVLGYRSPLYGRRTGQWKVGQLDPPSIWRFIPNYSLEDLLRVYGAAGGIPAYLKMFSPKLDFWGNIRKLYLSKGGFLYEEAFNLLRQELREPRTYMMILRSIADGKRRVTEIAVDTGLDKSAVSRYIDTLEMLDILGYETPILEKPKTRKRLYHLKDNYLNFWFRYVYPHHDMVEEGRSRELLQIIRENYSEYMGGVFEEVARKLLYKVELPFTPVKVGRQWGKTRDGKSYEIDIVAYDRDRRRTALFEVKWADLSYRDAKRIINSLKEKKEAAGIKTGDVHYGVIARQVENREKIAGEGYIVLTPKEILKIYRQRKPNILRIT